MEYKIGDTFIDCDNDTKCCIIGQYSDGKNFLLKYEDGTFRITSEYLLNHYFIKISHVKENTESNKSKTIKSCTFNEKKKVTTVVLDNDSVGMSKCSEQDDYDKYIGFALAYMNALFGSKTKFKKFVDKFDKK